MHVDGNASFFDNFVQYNGGKLNVRSLNVPTFGGWFSHNGKGMVLNYVIPKVLPLSLGRQKK